MSDIKETIFEKDHAHDVPATSSSLMTFGVLAVMAIIALAIGFSDLGPMKVLASLLLAGVQASFLAYYFMDLKQADGLTWLCVGAAIFWTFLLFFFTLTDYFTRYFAVL